MSTAADQINGTWTNAYASKATLQVQSTGIITGIYKSDAGVANVTEYRVFGYIDPAAPPVTANGKTSVGMPLSLMINWRGINQGAKPDPSWNFVSGMAGQLIFSEANQITMQFNHALIAANAYGAIVPGFYVDRLQYDFAHVGEGAGAAEPLAMPEMTQAPTSTWVSELDPSVKLVIIASPNQEFFAGGMVIGQEQIDLIGTTNTHYDPSVSPYKGIAFCGVTKAGTALSLSGWIDTANSRLVLQRYETGQQNWELRFFESRGSTLYMKPSP